MRVALTFAAPTVYTAHPPPTGGAGRWPSDVLDRPHTVRDYVETQHALLRRAGVEAPYVLVGHSLGGLNAQAYAADHPEHVAGMVLVDAAHPELFERVPELLGADSGFVRSMQVASRLGVVRGILVVSLEDQVPQLAALPPDVKGAYRAQLSRPRHWDQIAGMNARLPESLADASELGPLPDVPTAVVARGRPETFPGLDSEAIERTWSELQADLAAELSQGPVRIAEDSGHMIPLEQPGAVVEAVHEVLAEATP